MNDVCVECAMSELEIAAYMDGELEASARRRVEWTIEHCESCRLLVADLQVIHSSMAVEGAIAQQAVVPPGWSQDDGALFLARFRESRDAGTSPSEDLWRWLAFRLWPVSAGLLIGAIFAQGPASPDRADDFESQALDFVSTDIGTDSDVLADFLDPGREPDWSGPDGVSTTGQEAAGSKSGSPEKEPLEKDK